MKKFFCLFLTILPFWGNAQQIDWNFENTKLPIEKRVASLIGQLTLEEKVLQMLNNTPAIERLNVPAYDWWNECLHGVARTKYKVTVFPQAIAMAATWDVESIKKMADYTATEGRAIYNDASSKGDRSIYHGLTYWTPNINIFRDPRWGRGHETYGEDPYLTATMGGAFVKALQGDDPCYLKAAACAKHFAVHSGPEPSRHYFDVTVSPYDLWDTYLPAFETLVTQSKVAGVMCAYNAYASRPCCGNNLLMQSILRKQWKFNGYVTSDCGAIDDFYNNHKTHPNAASASADAVHHGTDTDCGYHAYRGLIEAVKQGLITEKELDVSLARLFTIRFKLGMFDPIAQVPFSKISIDTLECTLHKSHALKMARQSVVLLKNENQLLPLSKNLRKIAVLGPNADNADAVLGNYNGIPTHVSTALEGIKSKLSTGTQVVYHAATNYVHSLPEVDIYNMAASVSDADVIVFVGGISPRLEGEEGEKGMIAAEGFSGGDRTTILLPKVQSDMLKALKATGKPVVFVMMTGSAISCAWEAENIPAIVNCWYGGQAAGEALADVLFGDYNPAGRLPVTFYKEDSDLPDINNYEMQERTYRYFKGTPLFAFGHGLSYTTFDYSPIKSSRQVSINKPLVVKTTVTNSGKYRGEEVVQLYVRHPSNNNTPTPCHALKGFMRIELKAGESREVSFTLTPRELGVIDNLGNLMQYPENITIFVGGSQPGGSSVVTSTQVSVIGKERILSKNTNE